MFHRITATAVSAAASLAALISPLTPAAAADLREPRWAEHRPEVRPALWTGFYVGANLGAALGKIKTSDDPFNVHAKGVTGGVHAGYNWQIRNFVIGAEGDFDWAAADGRAIVNDLTAHGHYRSFGSLRGRAGLAFDNLLVFGTVGYGWTHVKLSLTDADELVRQSRTEGGLVYGGGIEYKLSRNISLRGEALRFDSAGHWHGTDGQRIRLHTPATEIRAGLTWHFN